jgi:hypothetical protein
MTRGAGNPIPKSCYSAQFGGVLSDFPLSRSPGQKTGVVGSPCLCSAKATAISGPGLNILMYAKRLAPRDKQTSEKSEPAHVLNATGAGIAHGTAISISILAIEEGMMMFGCSMAARIQRSISKIGRRAWWRPHAAF